MFKGWTDDDGLALFAALVSLFSLWQIQKALRTGKITSISWWAGERDRRLNPVGFWGSLVYYIGWVSATGWMAISYFAAGGRLPF
jgi:hypothetical protein